MKRILLLSLLFASLSACAAPEPATRTVRVRPSAELQRGEPIADPLAFVPSDSTSILRFDLDATRESSLYFETLMGWLELLEPLGRGGDAALVSLLSKTRLLYVTVDRYRDRTEPRCMILSGDYDRGQVEAAARRLLNQVVVANSFRERVEGRPAVVFGAHTLVQLDGDYTWLFCENRVLADAMDADGAPLLATPEFERVADDIGFRRGMIRMVGVGAPGLRDVPLEQRALLEAHADSVLGFAWALDLTDRVEFITNIHAEDRSAAEALAEVMPGLVDAALGASGLESLLAAAAPEGSGLGIRVVRDIAQAHYSVDAEDTRALMTRLEALALLSQGSSASD